MKSLDLPVFNNTKNLFLGVDVALGSDTETFTVCIAEIVNGVVVFRHIKSVHNDISGVSQYDRPSRAYLSLLKDVYEEATILQER